jgi:hypothetical protein
LQQWLYLKIIWSPVKKDKYSRTHNECRGK